MAVINIVGAIGAGKSTLAKKLNTEFGIPVSYESGKKDLSPETREVLHKYYGNPNKYALEKNMHFLKLREESLRANQDQPLYISERFLFDDYLLALVNLKSGQLTQTEFDEYKEAFTQTVSRTQFDNQTKSVVVFLNPDFKQTLDQIEQRGRDEELVSKHPELRQYYELVHAIYDETFKQWSRSPIIELDSVETTDLNELMVKIDHVLNNQ